MKFRVSPVWASSVVVKLELSAFYIVVVAFRFQHLGCQTAFYALLYVYLAVLVFLSRQNFAFCIGTFPVEFQFLVLGRLGILTFTWLLGFQ